MIRAVLAFCVLLAVGVLVCGCTAGSLSQAEQQSLAEAAAAPTKLQPGDKIKITVFGEDKLSGDYQLDQSGQISLPLAGTVAALGLTQTRIGGSAGQEISQRISQKSKGNRYNYDAPTLLHCGRGREAGRISLQEWPQRAHRIGHCWRSYISSKPHYGSNPATWRGRYARLSHIGDGSSLTRRCGSSS